MNKNTIPSYNCFESRNIILNENTKINPRDSAAKKPFDNKNGSKAHGKYKKNIRKSK